MAAVTKPDAPVGRGRELTAPPVKLLAQKHNIPVLQPEKLDAKFAEHINSLRSDAGVVVSYGKIIPQPILDLFPQGLINIHASLLPKYRGASPIESSILNGDSKTGVSLMKLDAGMDTGPVYATNEIPLNGTETAPELYGRLAELGAETLAAHLDEILGGELKAVPQDDSAATEAPMIRKSDGEINWTQPAGQIERQIRAYLGWPGSRSTLHGKEVAITEASGCYTPLNVKRQPGETWSDPVTSCLCVQTGQGGIMITKLKPAGKKEMTAADFQRGLPKA